MIIDKILDARDGFYNSQWDDCTGAEYIYDEATEFKFYYIADAFDNGTNEDCQKALCRYIDEQGYNPEIKEFIKTFQWVED